MTTTINNERKDPSLEEQQLGDNNIHEDTSIQAPPQKYMKLASLANLKLGGRRRKRVGTQGNPAGTAPDLWDLIWAEPMPNVLKSDACTEDGFLWDLVRWRNKKLQRLGQAGQVARLKQLFSFEQRNTTVLQLERGMQLVFRALSLCPLNMDSLWIVWKCWILTEEDRKLFWRKDYNPVNRLPLDPEVSSRVMDVEPILKKQFLKFFEYGHLGATLLELEACRPQMDDKPGVLHYEVLLEYLRQLVKHDPTIILLPIQTFLAKSSYTPENICNHDFIPSNFSENWSKIIGVIDLPPDNPNWREAGYCLQSLVHPSGDRHVLAYFISRESDAVILMESNSSYFCAKQQLSTFPVPIDKRVLPYDDLGVLIADTISRYVSPSPGHNCTQKSKGGDCPKFHKSFLYIDRGTRIEDKDVGECAMIAAYCLRMAVENEFDDFKKIMCNVPCDREKRKEQAQHIIEVVNKKMN